MDFCPYCTEQVRKYDSGAAWSEDDGWYHKACLYQAQKEQVEDERLDDPRHGGV